MNARCGALVLAVLSALLVALVPGAARSDTAPTPFSGSFAATACGTPTDFTVAGANETISVTVDATVPSNDLAVGCRGQSPDMARTDECAA